MYLSLLSFETIRISLPNCPLAPVTKTFIFSISIPASGTKFKNNAKKQNQEPNSEINTKQ